MKTGKVRNEVLSIFEIFLIYYFTSVQGQERGQETYKTSCSCQGGKQ